MTLKQIEQERDRLAKKDDDIFFHEDHLNPSDLNMAYRRGFNTAVELMERELTPLRTLVKTTREQGLGFVQLEFIEMALAKVEE